MPRVRTRYIAALKNPVEQTFFQDKTGALIYCNIYTEVGTDKELVQCEVCNLYFPVQGDRSTSNLRIHWGSVECGKEKERRKTEKLGIDPGDTDDYRDDGGVFGSDNIQEMIEDEREGRKRGMSEVSTSTTYSESRQPSPTKVQRLRMYNP